MNRQEAIEVVKKNWPDNKYTLLREALETLIPELTESKDERIRKYLIEELKVAKSVGELLYTIPQPTREECIAYLEKQKGNGRNITANLLEDGITGVQRELIEFLANNIDASWVDIIKSADAYAERIKNIIEKQKKQKPTEWSMEDKQNQMINLDHFKSYMLQYLQDAANRKDDSEIEKDTDIWAKKLLNLINIDI